MQAKFYIIVLYSIALSQSWFKWNYLEKYGCCYNGLNFKPFIKNVCYASDIILNTNRILKVRWQNGKSSVWYRPSTYHSNFKHLHFPLFHLLAIYLSLLKLVHPYKQDTYLHFRLFNFKFAKSAVYPSLYIFSNSSTS